MIETALSSSGRLDILVNNAGVFLSKPLGEVSHEDWATLMRVNLEAVFFVSQRAAKPMKEGAVGLSSTWRALRPSSRLRDSRSTRPPRGALR